MEIQICAECERVATHAVYKNNEGVYKKPILLFYICKQHAYFYRQLEYYVVKEIIR
jgi:hypothetical protein